MRLLTTTDLSSPLYAQAIAIRTEVFIDEQGIAADLELDALEGECVHMLLVPKDAPDAAVACCRVLPLSATELKVQRVAVPLSHRGQGHGVALMQQLAEWARIQGYARLVLGAQSSALGFYQNLGYAVTSEPYLSVGLWHQDMALILVQQD
ncbi:MAG: GNAT family N-acetyltransferase [Neisseriaceae bacterium]|nr:GNAT family N-acetyltransferase [Neisseriaceae bacterium]MBP6861972.1 GNAT family N-acetyltransferase [Neisseriaceae bacterium]